MSDNETVLETRVYNNIAIQNIDIKRSKTLHTNKIVISKSSYKPHLINGKIFKTPEMDDPIWIITASDLQVTENICLAIDALLCSSYHDIFKPDEAVCYNKCISNGPEFVAYDEQRGILYIDAGTNIEGTAGAPRFLFAANIHTKKIKYLNTFVAPFVAYLSPKGNYIAIFDEYNEIDVCNTDTGNNFEIHGKSKSSENHNLGGIKWLNDVELQYNDMLYNNQNVSIAETKKVFNVNSSAMLH